MVGGVHRFDTQVPADFQLQHGSFRIGIGNGSWDSRRSVTEISAGMLPQWRVACTAAPHVLDYLDNFFKPGFSDGFDMRQHQFGGIGSRSHFPQARGRSMNLVENWVRRQIIGNGRVINSQICIPRNGHHIGFIGCCIAGVDHTVSCILYGKPARP